MNMYKRIAYIYELNGQYGIAESICSPEEHPYPFVDNWSEKVIVAIYERRCYAEKRLAAMLMIEPIEKQEGLVRGKNYPLAKSIAEQKGHNDPSVKPKSKAGRKKDCRLHKFVHESGKEIIGMYSELTANSKNLLGISSMSLFRLKKGYTNCVRGWRYDGIVEPIGSSE